MRGICEHCYFPITVHPNHDSIIEYVSSNEFEPKIEYSEAELDSFVYGEVARAAANTNFAINPNDKTSVTKKIRI